MTSIVTLRLCGSIPMTAPGAPASSTMSAPVVEPVMVERGGHRYFRQHSPFFSLSGPAVSRRRMPCESHDPREGQPMNASDQPRHLDRACAGTDPPSMKQVADE